MKKRFKVLTYNIHKGFNFSNRKFVLPMIRDGLNELDADIVFLQEVLGEYVYEESVAEHRRVIVAPQHEFLADGGRHHSYGKNAIYTEGHHGNAVISKTPLVTYGNLNISTNRWEKRGMLHTAIKVSNGETIHLVCLHLNLLKGSRTSQIQTLCEHLQKIVPASCPMILAGDFNDWSREASKYLEQFLHLQECHKCHHGEYARSFPSVLPFLSLDRIYVRGLKVTGAACLVGKPWNGLSDHLPLMAEVEWEGKK